MKAEIVSLCLNENLGGTFTKKHLVYFQKKLGFDRNSKDLIDPNTDRKVVEHCIRNYKKVLLFDELINLKDLREQKGKLALHSQFIFTQVKEFVKEQEIKIDRILEKFNNYTALGFFGRQ